jgi:hypothetical protein
VFVWGVDFFFFFFFSSLFFLLLLLSQALLQSNYHGVTARVATEEARQARIFKFKVKKPQKKTEVLEKEMLYKKRIITVDWNDPPSVRYSSPTVGSTAKLFPGPDRVQRVSIELDNELAIQFFFGNASWKNKTNLRLFFRSMRERDMFMDVYVRSSNKFLVLNICLKRWRSLPWRK